MHAYGCYKLVPFYSVTIVVAESSELPSLSLKSDTSGSCHIWALVAPTFQIGKLQHACSTCK